MSEIKQQQRVNPAFDLLDEDKRRAILRPRQYTLPYMLKFISRPVFKSRRIVLAGLGYAVSSGLLPVLASFIVYYLTVILQSPEGDLETLLLYAGGYAVLFIILSVLATNLLNRNYNFFMELRIGCMNQALRQYMLMDLGLFENSAFLDEIGKWSWALSSNNAGLEGTWHKLFELGGTAVSVLLLGLLLSRQSPVIMLAGIAFVIVYYFIQANITKYKYERREEQVKLARRLGRLSDQAADFRYGKDMRLFRIYGLFKLAFGSLTAAFEKFLRLFHAREFQLSFAGSLSLLLIDVVSFFILSSNLVSGAITLPQFLMLITAVTLFGQQMLALAEGFAYVKREMLYFADTMSFLQADLRTSGGSGQIDTEGGVEIEFEQVSFSYPGSGQQVLTDLNLKIGKGETMALVGVNGAGKTTLVKLLTGLYQPTQGRILFNGTDISTVPQQDLFSLFSVVFQECGPLALTVAENVAGTDEGIDREGVVEALKAAGLWDKVSTFPQGIDQPLLKYVTDEGRILSGGENQKLAIARALYRKDSKVIVLDEPTASLDALAETKIYQDLERILAGRTAFFISHRLASTRFCDRIALLDGGCIKEQGTHEELMALGGLYREMFTVQSKYYQEREQNSEQRSEQNSEQKIEQDSDQRIERFPGGELGR